MSSNPKLKSLHSLGFTERTSESNKCCSLSSSDSSAKRCITTSCSIKRTIVYDTRNWDLAPSAPRRWSIETLQMAPDFLRCSQILKVKHLKFRNSNLIYIDQVCLRYSMATTKHISPPKLQKDTADTKRGQPVWVSSGNRSRTWAEAEASQLVARTRSSVGPTVPYCGLQKSPVGWWFIPLESSKIDHFLWFARTNNIIELFARLLSMMLR